MSMKPLDPALTIRAKAARHAIRTGQLTPDVALSYTVWPTPNWQRLTATVRP